MSKRANSAQEGDERRSGPAARTSLAPQRPKPLAGPVRIRNVFSRAEMSVRARLARSRAPRADIHGKPRLDVFPDYGGAFPVWLHTGMNDPEDVVLSADLRAALREWAREWEVSEWSDYNDSTTPSLETPWFERFQNWHARGRLLTERVQAEAGSDWDVVYGVEPDPPTAG
jgi:hypothetical protein